jgi:hypothetical protein
LYVYQRVDGYHPQLFWVIGSTVPLFGMMNWLMR